jgi:hypothetical protein
MRQRRHCGGNHSNNYDGFVVLLGQESIAETGTTPLFTLIAARAAVFDRQRVMSFLDDANQGTAWA